MLKIAVAKWTKEDTSQWNFALSRKEKKHSLGMGVKHYNNNSRWYEQILCCCVQNKMREKSESNEIVLIGKSIRFRRTRSHKACRRQTKLICMLATYMLFLRFFDTATVWNQDIVRCEAMANIHFKSVKTPRYFAFAMYIYIWDLFQFAYPNMGWSSCAILFIIQNCSFEVIPLYTCRTQFERSSMSAKTCSQ